MSSSSIIKRGYLFDKKMGLIPVAVDRKRWYVLRLDHAQGFCVLEYFKDEKTAAKGEAPKGFINVYDVVAVQRVQDKKQTFEILCPGVGYRLTANSDVEADEWTKALGKLVLYRRDGVKSLRRISSSPTHMETIPERHRTFSDTSLQTHHSPSNQQPLNIPTHHHPPADMALVLSHSPHFSHSLPTPPEMATSPPTLTYHPPPMMQRQRSNEFPIGLPSPSTSSDSSSMASGSNTSFEQQQGIFSAELERGDHKSRFRVHVQEADNLCVSGPADLLVADEGISLHSIQTGRQLVSWPISCLRRYGCNNLSFTILTGRFCGTGEGRFQFFTPHCRVINSKVHSIASSKAGRSLPRRASEPTQMSDSFSRSPQSSHLLNPPPTLPPRAYSTSPPTYTGYSRIHHQVVPPMSQESYSRIQRQAPLPVPNEEYSKLQHFNSSLSLTQSAIPSPPHQSGKPSEPVLKYAQLAFKEPDSPTGSV